MVQVTVGELGAGVARPGKFTPKNEDSLRGFGFALTAYLLWGFLPIFMKAVAHISPAEVIAHRVIWSIPIAGAVLWARGGRRICGWRCATADAADGLRDGGVISVMGITSGRWGGPRAGCGFGLYTTLVFGISGAVLLGERLSMAQKWAIALAALAVLVLTIEAGKLPLVALGLTVTWGIYAYLKKSLPIGPNQGFFLEVLILLPFAMGYVIWAEVTGSSHFMAGVTSDTVLLLACGLVTAVPLMVYANGAKLLRLSTIGIMQYIAPTMIFLTAVFVFGEPFGRGKMIAFPMIWVALVIYTVSMVRQARAAGK